jgi:hypothetical protein
LVKVIAVKDPGLGKKPGGFFPSPKTGYCDNTKKKVVMA